MAAAAVREAFGKASLYDILNVKKTATTPEIKKAYFKLALQFVSRRRSGSRDAGVRRDKCPVALCSILIRMTPPKPK